MLLSILFASLLVLSIGAIPVHDVQHGIPAERAPATGSHHQLKRQHSHHHHHGYSSFRPTTAHTSTSTKKTTTSTKKTTTSTKKTSSSTKKTSISTKRTTTSTKKTTVVTTSTSRTSSATTRSSSTHVSITTSASYASSHSTSTTSRSASSSSTHQTTQASPTSSSTAMPTLLRGVNIGGWLVVESWMSSDLFGGTNAVDQWTFDQTDGAAAKLESHWENYFGEADVKQMASLGINSMRIPIGFWSFNNTGTPYITGADAYLEKAIGWARTYGIKVLVDCHGSPGSQNGFDNSGHAGAVEWQQGTNMDQSTAVLVQMAKKYGSTAYADVVFGIELTNEPISWGANTLAKTQTWTKTAYAAVRAAASNKNLNIIMHDGFEGPSSWTSIGTALNGQSTLKDSDFWVDTHLYQLYTDAYNLLDQSEHIANACAWKSSELLPSSSNLPVIVGEWSVITNVCVNTDGTTTAGTSCSTSGCQCVASTSIEDWNAPIKAAVRQFIEAQLETFEAHARGWFLWSWNGPGAWGAKNLFQYDLLGPTASSRQYPDICSGY